MLSVQSRVTVERVPATLSAMHLRQTSATTYDWVITYSDDLKRPHIFDLLAIKFHYLLL